MIKIVQTRKPGRINVIAVDNKKIVGWIKIWTDMQSRFDWIIAVYFRPQYRGQGIFRMLMDKAKASTPNDLALRVNPYKDHEGQDPTELTKKYQEVIREDIETVLNIIDAVLNILLLIEHGYK